MVNLLTIVKFLCNIIILYTYKLLGQTCLLFCKILQIHELWNLKSTHFDMFYVIHFTDCGTWLVLQRSDRVRFTRPVEDTSMASDKSKTYFSNLTVMNGMKMDQGRYTCNVTTGRSQSTAVSKNVILVGQYLHNKLCY